MIGTICDGKMWLDVRTIAEEELTLCPAYDWRVRFVAALAVVSGCGFSHGASGSGPHDAANDGVLVDEGVADASDSGQPPSEASTPNLDTIIEAENYTLSVDRGTHAWSVMNDIAGHSGTGFEIVLPNNGTACTTTVEVSCSELQYAIATQQTGNYYLHARMYATTAADDSVWFGLDGLAQTSPFQPTHDSAWHWLTSGPFSMAAGAHTLSYWYRETGIRLDVVAVTTSATPPP